MSDVALFVLAFLGGLAVLSLGAEWLLRGSRDLALRMGVSPIVVGLTVVAFGTSAPELVVSIIAAIQDSPDVAVANVVGSNIANVGLIIGLTAIILPLPSDRSFLKMDMPLLAAAMALLFFISMDGVLSRLDGAILLAGLFGFIAITYMTSHKREKEEDKEEEDKPSGGWGGSTFRTAAGLICLSAGARAMVWGAVGIADKAGISQVVIGATIVAVGTSLPELATSLIAVIRKQPDIGLGNVIGSNVFNICSILGIAPIIKPLPIHSSILYAQYPIMIAFAALLAIMLAKKRNQITRLEGGILFAAYVAFMVWAFAAG